jgi:hypothetical protein
MLLTGSSNTSNIKSNFEPIYYKGILGNVAIERLTGINNKQLNHYATGHRKPSEGTKQKILNALHQFGQELMAVEL